MLSQADITSLVRELQRRPLHERGRGERLDAGRDVIMHILPHRDPLLLVDRLLEFDAERKTMLAESDVDPEDPVLAGHFPGAPLYPACLQNEAAGQAGLCLWSFAENDCQPCRFSLRIARIEHAVYLRPVRPGETMQLMAKLIHCDDLCVLAAAQVFVGERLCSIIIVNAVMVDD